MFYLIRWEASDYNHNPSYLNAGDGNPSGGFWTRDLEAVTRFRTAVEALAAQHEREQLFGFTSTAYGIVPACDARGTVKVFEKLTAEELAFRVLALGG